MRKILTAAAVLFVVQLGTTDGAQASNSRQTTKQLAAKAATVTGMPFTGTYLAPANLALQQAGAKKLPATRLDSFVRESGYDDNIYGDEGEVGPPPYSQFQSFNRINAGIHGDDQGLTTHHGSLLPSAWGKDEFIGGPEMSVSGPSGAAVPPVSLPQPLPVASDDDQSATGAWPDSDADGTANHGSPAGWDRNDPTNLPPGFIGIYRDGYFIGSYDSTKETLDQYLKRTHPMSYQQLKNEVGGGWAGH